MPCGAVVIFSAHGVAPREYEQAARRDLRVIDATCPLVTKVHREAIRLSDAGYQILLIGQPGHDETVGTLGVAGETTQVIDPSGPVGSLTVRDPSRVAWLSQTTLSVDETAAAVQQLRDRLPQLLDPPSDDICYAAENRQNAVKVIAPRANTRDLRAVINSLIDGGGCVVLVGEVIYRGGAVRCRWFPVLLAGVCPFTTVGLGRSRSGRVRLGCGTKVERERAAGGGFGRGGVREFGTVLLPAGAVPVPIYGDQVRQGCAGRLVGGGGEGGG